MAGHVIVADPGQVKLSVWVDPVVATVLYPELGYIASVPWMSGITYTSGIVVDHNTELYQASQDAPTGEPGVEGAVGWDLLPGAYERNLRVEIALSQATWLLDTLTRGRLHGVECWIEDYIVRSCEVTLLRQPVSNIKAVTVVRDCGRVVQPMPLTDWCQVNANTISVCCSGCGFSQSACGCGNTMIRVEYEIGANFPPGTASLIAWLANELVKSATGKPCALPDRVTSISRQGVSWTMLDPMDFLDKGLTGIGRVDQWLAAVARAMGTAVWIDPLRSNRAFTQQAPCAAGGQFGDQNLEDTSPEPFSSDFNIGASS